MRRGVSWPTWEARCTAYTTLYIATTNDHDAKFQQEVRIYSDKRVAAGNFAVSVLFWEDVVGGLALNPAVFKVHYPTVHLPDAQTIDRDRLLAAAELGYYGPYLWEYIQLTLGEMGMMANADPEDVPVLIGIVEQWAQQLLPPKDANAVLSNLAEITKVINEPSAHSDEQIVTLVLELQYAGSHAAGAALAFLWYVLLTRPDLVERLRPACWADAFSSGFFSEPAAPSPVKTEPFA